MPKMSEAKNVGITDVPKGPQYKYLVVLGELPDGLVMRYEDTGGLTEKAYLHRLKVILPAEHDITHGDIICIYKTLEVQDYEVYTTLALDELSQPKDERQTGA